MLFWNRKEAGAASAISGGVPPVLGAAPSTCPNFVPPTPTEGRAGLQEVRGLLEATRQETGRQHWDDLGIPSQSLCSFDWFSN